MPPSRLESNPAAPSGATRLRSLAALVVIGAMVALGLAITFLPPRGPAAPETVADSGPSATPASAAPAAPVQPAAPSPVEKMAEVGRGDTLAKVLRAIGVPQAEAHEAISALRDVYNPRALMPGQSVTATYAPGVDGAPHGPLMQITLAPDLSRDIRVSRAEDGGFVATEDLRPFKTVMRRAAGVIDDSLYQSGRAAGLPAPLLVELIRIYSWSVDFQRDIQPGDRFDVTFERQEFEGGGARDGNILTATLRLSGTDHNVFRFTGRDGHSDYYDLKGRSVRKTLMRTPIDGARLSSRFGKRRHPILGYTKMHRGLDFAAPRGTPIYAAGNGTVTYRGTKGAYGRYISIRHNNRYSTAYAHLHRYGQGIKKGSRVRQGQVIGYVGSSGRSTGPHLHYEVLVGGRQVNPLSLKLPAGMPLKGAELAQFQDMRAQLEAKLAGLAAVIPTAGQ